MQSKTQAPPRSLVLGGGGNKGISHVGLWHFLVEHGIEIDDITGNSIGAIVATFLKNGISTPVILDMFLNVLGEEKLTPLMDERPFMQELVDRYQLEPKDGLRIVAFDPLRMCAVVFEGTDYDLVTALTATCAVPFVTRPVRFHRDGKKHLLIDGGFYRLHPTRFCNHPAIVSKLISVPLMRGRDGDLAVHVGHPKAKIFGHLTKDQVDEFYRHGYEQAERALNSLVR